MQNRRIHGCVCRVFLLLVILCAALGWAGMAYGEEGEPVEETVIQLEEGEPLEEASAQPEEGEPDVATQPEEGEEGPTAEEADPLDELPFPFFPFEEVEPIPLDALGGYPPDPSGYVAEWAYGDGSISVRIKKDRILDTDYVVAYVQIAHPSQLRTAVAGSHNADYTALGSVIAKRVNAVLAINGDWYSYRGGGYIIRQGKEYRSQPNKLDVLLIDDHGDFHVVEKAKKDDITAFKEGLGDLEIVNSFAFGPLLVKDGKRPEEIIGIDVGALKKTQRMGIAQMGPLSYMCVSTEGPEDPGSEGFTMLEFAELMESLGAKVAYNLDGGSSNSMIFQNQKINSPKNPKVRYIFDIIYFASAMEGEEP